MTAGSGQEAGPGGMRALPFLAALLLIFSALVSGSIYPWAKDAFILASLALFTLSLAALPPAKHLLPLIPLVSLTALSLVWTININNTAEQLFMLGGLAAFACAVSAAGGKARAGLLAAAFAVSVLVALYGIYQYFIGFAHTDEYLKSIAAAGAADGLARKALRPDNRRAFSTMLSPNALAGYLAMAFPLGVSLARVSGNRKYLYLAGLAPIFIALLLTKSVGGSIAFASGLVVYFAAGARGGQAINILTGRDMLRRGGERSPGREKRPGRRIAAAALVLVLAAVVAGIVMKRSAGEFAPGRSVSERLNYWSGAYSMFMKSPVLGNGPGSFQVLYPGYVKPGTDETRYAHNLALQTMAETGTAGLAAVLFVFVAFFARGLKKITGGGDDGVLSAGIFAAGAAFFVHNLLDFSYFIPETAAFFWFLFGMSAAGEGRAGSREKARAAMRILFACAAAAMAFFFLKSYLAGQKKADALDALRERGVRNFAEARAGPVPPEAVKLAEDASKLKPYDDGCRRFLAGLYEGRGEPGMAEGEYKEAIRLNPYYPFHYRDLGLFYLKAGDGGKAAESFQKAAERYPASEELKKYSELARKTAGRPPR